MNGATGAAGALTTTGGINGNGGTVKVTSTAPATWPAWGRLPPAAVRPTPAMPAATPGRGGGSVRRATSPLQRLLPSGLAGHADGAGRGGRECDRATAAGSRSRGPRTLNSSGGNSSAGGNAKCGNAGSITLEGGGATPLSIWAAISLQPVATVSVRAWRGGRDDHRGRHAERRYSQSPPSAVVAVALASVPAATSTSVVRSTIAAPGR